MRNVILILILILSFDSIAQETSGKIMESYVVDFSNVKDTSPEALKNIEADLCNGKILFVEHIEDPCKGCKRSNARKSLGATSGAYFHHLKYEKSIKEFNSSIGNYIGNGEVISRDKYKNQRNKLNADYLIYALPITKLTSGVDPVLVLKYEWYIEDMRSGEINRIQGASMTKHLVKRLNSKYRSECSK